MTDRIYLVTLEGTKHLVAASSKLQAFNHVISQNFTVTVEVPNTVVMAELIQSGVKIEHVAVETKT